MNTKHPDVPWLPPDHLANRQRVSAEELARHAGKYVAWSWQGSEIVAAAQTEEDLWEQLIKDGIDPQRVVFSFIDPE